MELTDLPCDVCDAKIGQRCRADCRFYEPSAREANELHKQIAALRVKLDLAAEIVGDSAAAHEREAALAKSTEMANRAERFGAVAKALREVERRIRSLITQE